MRSQELLQELARCIPPPEHPDRVRGSMLNSCFGPSIELPEDYRMFLDMYGPGWFIEDRFPAFHILDLVSDAEQEFVPLVLRCADEVHELAPDRFPRAYPVVPGLLPWGTFDQGQTFYWWVDGPPDSWRVRADDRSEVVRYDCSMLEFLAVNLTPISGETFFKDKLHFSGFWPLSKYKVFQAGGIDAVSELE